MTFMSLYFQSGLGVSRVYILPSTLYWLLMLFSINYSKYLVDPENVMFTILSVGFDRIRFSS